MPPYGAPVPYPALYPPAGVYAHPNIPMVINPFGIGYYQFESWWKGVTHV